MRAKRWAEWAVVAGSLWLLATGAGAQGPHRQPPGGNVGGGGPQRMMPAQRPEPASARNEAAPQGGGRLSPEERRQLRRDVHDAGRDLYSDRMPPGRGEGRRQ